MTELNTGFDFSADELNAGEDLFSIPATFVLGVVQLEQLPHGNRTEVAFAGRSNVGKSSILNALVGQNGLARTSNTPGRTQEMNFFNVADRFYLVDLPGYGYAEVSKSKVKAWTQTLKQYLKGRVQLKLACVLVDARHGIKANDEEIMTMLDQSAVSYQVVLTKADKLKKTELEPMLKKVQEALKKHPAAYPIPIMTSSKTSEGIDILRAKIAKSI